MPQGRTIRASSAHEAFYQDAAKALKKVTDRHRGIRTIEVIACLGRMLGYTVAMCGPDERDLARLTAVENMDQATADLVPHLVGAPPPSGRA